MSRSAFLTTNEIPTTNDLCFHHGLITPNRTNETLPIVVQSSNKSIERNLKPRIKRNLKDKRRPTGIRPNDISLASTSTEGSANEDGEEEDNVSTRTTESNESFDHNRTIQSSSSIKSVFKVSRIQSSFENLSIPPTDPYIVTSAPKIFRSEEFILRRKEKQTSDDDPSTINYRQLEERILALESLVYDKDNTIHDLQRKLNDIRQDLADAEQQIYLLHQDKLTLIKAFTTL